MPWLFIFEMSREFGRLILRKKLRGEASAAIWAFALILCSIRANPKEMIYDPSRTEFSIAKMALLAGIGVVARFENLDFVQLTLQAAAIALHPEF
jgi:hypothetical protein